MFFFPAVALPKGLYCENASTHSSFHDIIEAFDQAAKYCVQGLTSFDKRGSVAHVRGAALSLTAIKTFQSILGKSSKYDPSAGVHLIGMTHVLQHTYPYLISDIAKTWLAQSLWEEN